MKVSANIWRHWRSSRPSRSNSNTEVVADDHVFGEFSARNTFQYHFQDLVHATDYFQEQNRLGEGSFSVVYKGRLPNGATVAIKRMKVEKLTGEVLAELDSEVKVLSCLHHRNLVSLLGQCADGKERLLVYEYMEKDTLKHHILEYKKHGLQPLDWRQRLSIALDIAHGMEYLHSLNENSIIHRDLKPSNILLDKNMRAKVADFGLIKVLEEGRSSAETVHLKGTFGYMAPEAILEPSRVATARDVYSFGVILEVLITGRRSVVTSNDSVYSLVDVFREVMKSDSEFMDGIDGTLKVSADSTSDTVQSIRTVATLALQCTSREPHFRPPMGHVVRVLAELGETWTCPDLNATEQNEIALNDWKQLSNEGPQLSNEGLQLLEGGLQLSNEGPQLSNEGPQLSKEGEQLPNEGQSQRQRVQQVERGVYIFLSALPGGGNDLRVKFSRKRFTELQANRWWADNGSRIYGQYDVRTIYD